MYAKLCFLLKAEQNCLLAIKSSDREMKEILTARTAEEREIVLVISVYDTVRNDTVGFHIIGGLGRGIFHQFASPVVN